MPWHNHVKLSNVYSFHRAHVRYEHAAGRRVRALLRQGRRAVAARRQAPVRRLLGLMVCILLHRVHAWINFDENTWMHIN